jgi:hypothetical protein
VNGTLPWVLQWNMKPTLKAGVLAAACALPLAAGAAASSLYKHVDKDGRVTYTDRPPSGIEGKVVTIPVDQFPPPAPRKLATSPREETEYEKIIRRKAPEPDTSELKAAQKRLADAKAALEDEQNSTRPEDWIYRQNNTGRGGPTLRYPTPEYAERLAARESDVKKAQEDLETVERKLRQ